MNTFNLLLSVAPIIIHKVTNIFPKYGSAIWFESCWYVDLKSADSIQGLKTSRTYTELASLCRIKINNKV